MVVGILGGGNEKNGISGDWESRIIAGRCIWCRYWFAFGKWAFQCEWSSLKRLVSRHGGSESKLFDPFFIESPLSHSFLPFYLFGYVVGLLTESKPVVGFQFISESSSYGIPPLFFSLCLAGSSRESKLVCGLSLHSPYAVILWNFAFFNHLIILIFCTEISQLVHMWWHVLHHYTSYFQ